MNSVEKQLVGRRVAVSPGQPPAQPQPGTIYFVVDGRGKLLRDPRLPYEGEHVNSVVREMEKKYGLRSVETSTMERPLAGKVHIIYNPQTERTTKVLIPSQWSTAPRTLRFGAPQRHLLVALNPPATRTYSEPTLVLQTDAAGIVTRAVRTG